MRPFPAAEGLWKISIEGGEQPRWRGDGKELFFAGADGMMMAGVQTLHWDGRWMGRSLIMDIEGELVGKTTVEQAVAIGRQARLRLQQFQHQGHSPARRAGGGDCRANAAHVSSRSR